MDGTITNVKSAWYKEQNKKGTKKTKETKAMNFDYAEVQRRFVVLQCLLRYSHASVSFGLVRFVRY